MPTATEVGRVLHASNIVVVAAVVSAAGVVMQQGRLVVL